MPLRTKELTQETAGHAPYRLMEEIIALSAADNWHAAKLEWDLATVYFVDSNAPGTCLCGHFPIIEHCVLVNHLNFNQATVGNVCVTRFMGLASEGIFASLRRVRDDRTAALNPAAIEYAKGKGWLNDWEHEFYLNTWRKRKLSPRQWAKRKQINARVLSQCYCEVTV